jgi:hypothetical protein
MTKRYIYGAIKRPTQGAIRPFLIDRPKRLEIAVTPTKQTTEAVSNRIKNNPLISSRPGLLPAVDTARERWQRNAHLEASSSAIPAASPLLGPSRTGDVAKICNPMISAMQFAFEPPPNTITILSAREREIHDHD